VTITDIPAAGVGVGVALGVGVTVTVGNGVGEGVPPGEIVGLGDGPPLLETIRLGEITHPSTSASNSGTQNRNPDLIKAAQEEDAEAGGAVGRLSSEPQCIPARANTCFPAATIDVTMRE
jgi:hypothetical protein